MTPLPYPNLTELLPFLLIAQVVTKYTSTLRIEPPLLWLIIGIILCLVELIIPKNLPKRYKFIALIMGISALIMSFILSRATTTFNFEWQYIMYEGFSWQIIYWMALSLSSIIWLRPMFLKRQQFTIAEATEATTLTQILPGETGRVLYEGTSWQARCADQKIAIAPNQNVCVIRREDNTLIVAPENWFRPSARYCPL